MNRVQTSVAGACQRAVGARRSHLACVAAASLMAAISMTVDARAQDYFVRADADASTGGYVVTNYDYRLDTGPVHTTSISAGQFFSESTGPGSDFNGNAYTVTDIGAIHATAYGEANTGSPGAGGGSGFGVWSDTITITSDTLPFGTPVSFLATDVLHRTIDSMIIEDGNSVVASADLEGPLGLSLKDSLSSPNGTGSVSTIYNTTIGATFTISSRLDVSAGVTVTNPPFNGSATVNAGNTALFEFEPLTAGASYTTASGVQFVPEPASMWLICCGIIAAGLYGLRYRRLTARLPGPDGSRIGS